jgi:hypothetical protein
MRSIKQLTIDLVKKPPVLFPLVGAFHIFWLLISVWIFRHQPFPGLPWLEVVWMIGYTVFWLAACDLRKWGAIGYILLTLVNISIFLGVVQGKHWHEYNADLLFIDALFSFFLLFYFKRFQ